MITYLEIVNFKSHKKTALEFNNLTVLCGSNAVGKSTIIQALLLLRESYLANSNFDYLDLKSNPVNIGTIKDALYQFASKDEISFILKTQNNNFPFKFSISKESESTKSVIYKSRYSKHISDKKVLNKESLFNKNCQFISAARFGPLPSYPKDDVVVEIYNQISVIEGKAEHFIHYLMKYRDRPVLKNLRNTSTESEDLFYQTMAWEREISAGVNIVIQDIGNLGYELKYQFNTISKNLGKTNEFKANNVGFGLTYVMPIIVAILSAPKGGILFIENPEAHLHPNGQAKLAELICLASQEGIQIVLETHSDHMINGMLVQAKKFEEQKKGIARNFISIHHFTRDDTGHSTNVKKINVEDGGRIRYTPDGFFDRFTIDRKYLMGF